jgi:PleD family two-component response regulator
MSGNHAAARILLVDGNNFQRKLRAEILTREGYRVYPATHPEEAISRCRPGAFDLLLINGKEDENAALQFCNEVRRQNPKQLIIMLTQPFAFVPPDACANDVVRDGPRELVEQVGATLATASSQTA